MKFGILVFPGSNCDHDCYHVVKHLLGRSTEFVWHKNSSLKGMDALILPGGFSYGDYLRSGAIARFSPIMTEVRRFARSGGPVLGICNGFQILVESGLLPGALIRNRSLRFICEDAHIRVENTGSPFTNKLKKGTVIRVPIAHGEGNYFADQDTLNRLEDNGRIAFRYATPDGEVSAAANPNGSLNNIAGVFNEAGNVLGMMPHPERCSEPILGNTDGRGIFESLVSFLS